MNGEGGQTGGAEAMRPRSALDDYVTRVYQKRRAAALIVQRPRKLHQQPLRPGSDAHSGRKGANSGAFSK